MKDADIMILDLCQDARALNAAIDNASTEHIGFADAGAAYPNDYFATLASALTTTGCSAAQGTLLSHEGKPLSLMANLPKTSTVLDVETDPSLATVFPHGMLVRTKDLQASGVRFSTELARCKDELFALQLCEAFPQRAYVSAAAYQAAQVFDETSRRTLQSMDAAWYWELVRQLPEALAQPDVSLSRVSQFGLLYLIKQRLESNFGEDMKFVFADTDEIHEYLAAVGRLAQLISDEVLFARSPRNTWERYKLFYLARLRSYEPAMSDAVDASATAAAAQPASVNPLTGKPALGGRITGNQDGGVPLPDTRIEIRDGDASLVMAQSGAEVTTFSEQYLRVQAVRLQADSTGQMGLDIDFVIESLFPASSYSVEFINSYASQKHAHAAQLSTRIGGRCTFFEIEAFRFTSYHVFVPLASNPAKQVITARIRLGSHEFTQPIRVWSAWQTHLYWNSKRSFWSIPGYIVQAYNDAIRIEPASKFQKFTRQLSYLASLKANKKVPNHIFKWRLLYFLTRPYFKGKRIWAYYDKGFKGGDNAEYAYAYAHAQNDGIEKAYYIEPNSEDGKRMAALGYKTLAPGSTKGILYALNAEVIYMTHVPAFRKMGIPKAHIRYFLDLVNPKCIRMYHGFPMTSDLSFTQVYSDYAGVVIGSEYERELYTGPDCEFLPEQILACGMPRYDDLVDNSERQLLFAPTWRPMLHGGESESGASYYNEHFKESKYFERYNTILNDDRLLETARRTGYKIKLFLHPRLAVQTRDFAENDVVQPLDCTKDTDYVTIMRASDLMVTDFSSVMYDFAFMHKPVVYYHDPALPYWRTVEFSYRDIGFGEVCEDADTLVNVLCSYMENDCALKPEYKERIERFFVNSGRDASQLVYEATRALVG